MIDFGFETKCYSCTACMSECPKNAIILNEKLQPEILIDKCIKCNACEKVCIALNTLLPEITCIEKWNGYVARNRNVDIRRKSSSGGIFFQIAKNVIDNGGYVCGCVFDEEFMPEHILTNKIEDVKKMMGSKYVKSDLKDCINRMKNVLADGIQVLFSGVPCQIAAVKRIIKNENLITVAVVCHGSIERDVWKKYLKEESEKGTIIDVSMRDKSHGWLNYGMRFTFSNGLEDITYRKEKGYFLKCFTDGLLERERCLECEYKGKYIISDLLLGDAWGMDKVYPELIDENGASVVITCTSKGYSLFDNIKEKIDLREIAVEKIIENNQRIITSAPENPFRKKFVKDLKMEDCNLHSICQKYAENTLQNRLKKKMYRLLKL